MQPFGLIPVLEDDDLTLFGMLSFFLFQLLHFIHSAPPFKFIRKIYFDARFHIYNQAKILLGKKKLCNFSARSDSEI